MEEEVVVSIEELYRIKISSGQITLTREEAVKLRDILNHILD